MKVVSILAAVLVLVAAANNTHFLGRSAEVDSVASAIAPVAIPSSPDQSQEAGPEVKLVLLALMRVADDAPRCYSLPRRPLNTILLLGSVGFQGQQRTFTALPKDVRMERNKPGVYITFERIGN